MTLYETYKPLRNVVRRFGLVQGLVGVWGYALHISHHRALPRGFAAGVPLQIQARIGDHLHPWDLDIIARELLLNAGPAGSMRLEQWNDLAKVVNLIRRVDDAI